MAMGGNNERAVASILNAVLGSCYGGQEIILCNKVTEYNKDVLMPAIMDIINNKNAQQN